MSVEVMCEKSFSEVDRQIVDRFVELQKALINADEDKLNEILCDKFKLVNVFASEKSKGEFIAMIEDKILDYSKSDIMEPTILWDDEDSASLTGDVRLTAKINGSERRWISKTVVSFKKSDGKWCAVSWDN